MNWEISDEQFRAAAEWLAGRWAGEEGVGRAEWAGLWENRLKGLVDGRDDGPTGTLLVLTVPTRDGGTRIDRIGFGRGFVRVQAGFDPTAEEQPHSARVIQIWPEYRDPFAEPMEG